MKSVNTLTVKKKTVSALVGLLRVFLFATLTFVVIYPVLTQISASFMSVSDVFNSSVQYIPKSFTLNNYISLWSELDLDRAFLLTIQYTLLIALLQTASATIIGYGLARFNFALNKPLFIMALISLALPPTLFLIPLYKIFANFDIFGIFALISGHSLNLLNNELSMVIMAVTATGYRCGLYIILMRQYFRGVPKELEEAAYIDGAGTVRTFLSVMLPNAKTMMITIGLFGFVWTWLDSDFAPTLMYDMPLLSNKFDLIQSIVFSKANSEVLTSLYSDTAVVYTVIPLVILYLFTQKFFVQSVERSGLVG